MDTEWRDHGKRLVARMDCRAGKTTLESGNCGWYAVRFAEWLYDWKLRIQCSITEPTPTYGYGRPVPHPHANRPGAAVFRPENNSFVQFIVENDVVEIEFLIPDCIDAFKHGGWAVPPAVQSSSAPDRIIVDLSSGQSGRNNRHSAVARTASTSCNHAPDERQHLPTSRTTSGVLL